VRVALYYPWIYLTSGAERTILELTGRSRHHWTLFTNRFDPEHTFPGYRDRHVVELPRVPVDRHPAVVARAAWRILRQRLPLEDHDALLVVCEGLGDLIVFRNSTRAVPVFCCCLTPLRMAFDPAYQARVLAQRGGLGRLALRLGAALFRWIDRRAWARYCHVFFISREAARRAREGGLVPSGDVEIIHPASGVLPRAPGEVFEPFFLVAGRIMWTKNVEVGIRAFQWFQTEHPELSRFRLVVAGIVDDKSGEYLAFLRELAGQDPRIEFRVFPSDEELADLYRTCYTVMFTPFNEDWGMVPLEAMAFGKPVIAVNRGGPAESVEDGVQGFLVEPEPEAFGRRMAWLAERPQEAAKLGNAGVERARIYSWDTFTKRIDDVIDRLAAMTAARPPASDHARQS
jgi:glycosyltransferase involved in cell wall biosynthesis